MTLAGTNTYVVAGDGGAYVIDPGPADRAHVAAVRAAAEAHGPILGILLTHGHLDHTEAVELLDEPVLWDPVPDAEETTVGSFEIAPSPGHAADHVCFRLGSTVFCGDLVLGHGSAIVPPRSHGGSLADYMSSLRRLATSKPTLLAPGHGPWITDPAAKLADYAEHRRARGRALLAALEAGERSRARLLDTAWADVPGPMRPAAAVAMQAHLEQLEAEGRLNPAELVD